MNAIKPKAVALTALCLAAPAALAGPADAKVRSCARVHNPFPGTRYADVDLTHIRVRNGTCKGARRVAKGAQRKALGITPNATGFKRFHWGGWRVKGDIRGDHDRYLAVKGRKRVRWVF